MKTILSFAAILVTVCGMAACSDDDGNGGEGGEARTSTTTTTGGGDGTGDGTGGDGTGDGTGGDGTGGDGTGDGTGGDGTGDGTGGDGTGDGTGGDSTGGTCEGEVGDACRDCCLEANQAGAVSLTALMFVHCGCATDAPCVAACNTTDPATDVCAEDGTVSVEAISANVPCVECTGELDRNTECIDQVTDACLADEGCTAYVQCFGTCPEN